MEKKKNKQVIEKIKEKYIQQAFNRCGEVFEEKDNEEGCEALTFDEIEDIITPYITTMINKVIKEPDIFVGTVKACRDSEFHGIQCMEMEDELGFEGCYNDDINHPDPRPGHQIWLKKLHAEKLYKLFGAKK